MNRGGAGGRKGRAGREEGEGQKRREGRGRGGERGGAGREEGEGRKGGRGGAETCLHHGDGGVDLGREGKMNFILVPVTDTRK